MIISPDEKPAYSDPLGVYNTLPLVPPFFFQGMTARIFPLRASPFQIDVFCNTYLNFIPQELGRFRAFLPYVFLMVLDYGKLAAPVANIGWLSQYEIMFAVPVEWYKVKDGRWEFQNWTWLTPFIYVDSELSLLLGRQTYGWPKSLMRLTPAKTAWMDDPMSPVARARAAAMVLPELFVGATQKPAVFLDIRQEATLLSSQLPPDFGGTLMPWMALGNAVQTVAGVMGDLVKVMNGVGLTRMQEGADPQNFMKMAQIAAAMMDPYNPDMYFNTINLKQFRDSREPENYCYQALTNAPMRLKQFNQGGLLGDVNQMAGDASGGFVIDLHEWPGYPIVEMLGLEVARSYRGDGVDVAQLKPVFPFWYNVDMIYDKGINLAWRTFDTDWHGPSGERYTPPRGTDHPLERRYNSTLGVSSSQTAAGVFEFTDTTARVLPLLASKAALQKFLDEYMNLPMNSPERTPDPLHSWFEVWGPNDPDEAHAHVYMVATTYGPMAAAEANVGAWQSESLQILVPVRWMQLVDGTPTIRGLGLVPAYTFSDSTEAVISGSEVLGIPTTKGVFVSPPNTWMSKEVELATSQPLLNVSAEVLPAVDLGQQAELRQVISIAQGPILPPHDTESWERMLEQPVAHYYREQRRKRALRGRGRVRDSRAMAIDILANNHPFHLFTMKQFRDVENPEVACYQSIVRIPNYIDHIYDMREIEEPMYVEIREYPTLPIMRLLGLVGHLTTQQQGGGVVFRLTPSRPFWFRAKWKQDRGERLWYRSGTTKWSQPNVQASTGAPPPGTGDMSFGGEMARRTLALRRLDWLLARGNPSDLDALVRDSIDEGFQDDPPLTAEERLAAVTEIDPQMVIESILSREWFNRDTDSRWQSEYKRLVRKLDDRIETAPRSQEKQVVAAFVRELRYMTVARFHLTKTDPAYQRMVLLVERFTERENMFAEVEAAYTELQRLRSEAKSVERDGERAQKFEDLFSAMRRAQPNQVDRLHESPAESKRRRILESRIKELLQELTGLPDAALSAIMNGDDLGPLSYGGDPSAFIQHCIHSFQNHPQRWKEIIRLLRHEREERRRAILKTFSKTAKKPDFCVQRDMAGPFADRVFPIAGSFERRWFEGERDRHRGEDVFPMPPDKPSAGTMSDAIETAIREGRAGSDQDFVGTGFGGAYASDPREEPLKPSTSDKGD